MKLSQDAMPMKSTKGGGSAKMSQANANGTPMMNKGPKLDKYEAYKGDGGAKNGRNVGKGC